MRNDDLLSDAKEAFHCAMDAEAENRASAREDLRFARLAEQWPEEILRERAEERRPALTVNRMPTFIRQVVNDARQNKPAIVCHPVDSNADPETAEIMNGLIRNIEYASDAEVAYDTALENAVSAGWGYWRVTMDYASDDTFDLDLGIARVPNLFAVYADPAATGADSADWNTAFVCEYMRREEFEKKYPKAEISSWEDNGNVHLSSPWLDGNHVLVAEWWRREQVEKPIVLLSDGSVMGKDAYLAQKPLLDLYQLTVSRERVAKSWKVTQHLLTGGEVLESNDWVGKYIPIVPVYGEELNIEGKRYFRSLIRDAKDSQRMFNFWRTSSTEMVALAPKTPFIGPEGAFDVDTQKWEQANVKSWAYLQYKAMPGMAAPQRQPYAGPPTGAIQEALNASDDLKSIMGLYDASLGARSNETSGRAILMRQREGDVGTFHFIDNLSRALRHTGRILLDLIPQVYTAPRVVRVLGQDKKPSILALGQPMPGADGESRVFDLSVGKYDVTVEAGPSFTTRREEAAAQMTELIRSYPPAAPIIGDLLAKNLDWPGADEIARRLEKLLPPQLQSESGAPQGPDPQMQQFQQQIQQLQSALAACQQELQQAQQDKSLEAQKLQIEMYNAETKRLQAQAQAMRPSALPYGGLS